MGRLDVQVVELRNLPTVGITDSAPDPFVTVELENQTFTTTVAKNTKCPKFAETFKFTIADPTASRVKVTVKSKGLTSDDFLGQYYVSVDSLTLGLIRDDWFILQQCKTNGEIRVQVLALDFGAGKWENWYPMGKSFGPKFGPCGSAK